MASEATLNGPFIWRSGFWSSAIQKIKSHQQSFKHERCKHGGSDHQDQHWFLHDTGEKLSATMGNKADGG